ncbi:MAG: hypothetical protein ACYDCN_00850 [Bacteroidia bacterium]
MLYKVLLLGKNLTPCPSPCKRRDRDEVGNARHAIARVYIKPSSNWATSLILLLSQGDSKVSSSFTNFMYTNSLNLSSTSSDLAAVPVGTEVFAWHIARYESNKGVLGDACGAIRAQILRP